MNDTFRRTYFVNWGDIDTNYRLTKIAATKYFQETFALYCAKNNLAAFDIDSQNLIWVVSDIHIDFTANIPFWSENFDVEMWISEKTKMRTYCDFRLYKNEEIFAQGESCWYILDKTSRRPVKTEDILKILEANNQKVFGEFEKQIYSFVGNKVSQKEHIVTVRDLDFNYHVNNLSYVGLALETIPSENLEKYKVDSYSVKFLKEAYLDDILTCEIYKTADKYSAKIFNKKDNSDVCYLSAKYSKKTDFTRNPRSAGIRF